MTELRRDIERKNVEDDMEIEKLKAERQAGADEFLQNQAGEANLRDLHRNNTDNWPTPTTETVVGMPGKGQSNEESVLPNLAALQDSLSRGLEGTGKSDPHSLIEDISALQEASE